MTSTELIGPQPYRELPLSLDCAALLEIQACIIKHLWLRESVFWKLGWFFKLANDGFPAIGSKVLSLLKSCQKTPHVSNNYPITEVRELCGPCSLWNRLAHPVGLRRKQINLGLFNLCLSKWNNNKWRFPYVISLWIRTKELETLSQARHDSLNILLFFCHLY